MQDKLSGKKLLILGANKAEIEIVKAAKTLGIYTIVTDKHENWESAPAKYIADEAWNVSWSDIDTLYLKCKEHKIDGCLAGFSEKRVLCAQTLCQKLKKPFYSDGASLEIIFDKIKFKKACSDCGISVAKSFSLQENMKYPVIIKPADNGGSKGITICNRAKDLEQSFAGAMECSEQGRVTIEEYIVADEVMIYYTVHDGIIDLSAMCDRYMQRFGETITQLPIGYFYPSKYLKLFMDVGDEKFKKLIHSLGIQNGLIAFQAFVKDNDFIPFDPTYRLDGTMAYHIVSHENSMNVLEMLILYSLKGTMGDSISQFENPLFQRKYFELPVLLGKGIISAVIGMEDILHIPEVIHVHQRYDVGDEMKQCADFSQIFCRIHICSKNISDLKRIMNTIYHYLQIVDEKNNDMIIGRFDVDLLEKL